MGIAKLCVVQLSSSMKLAALAFAALAVMAVAVDVSENIHELDDDLAMVEVMHGAGGACDTEIRAAKAKCGERLAYFKKIHESSCGDKDLARVMGRIKRNHAKTKKQQAQLKAAENALRSGKYKEKNVSQLARAARERLLKAMVTQIHQKNALKSSTQLAINEPKDEKSTRAKAHKATVKAVKLAKTSKDMAPVNTQAGKAKALYNKMVEEKVKEGRRQGAGEAQEGEEGDGEGRGRKRETLQEGEEDSCDGKRRIQEGEGQPEEEGGGRAEECEDRGRRCNSSE